MKYHYLILNKKLLLWNVLHAASPISKEEAEMYIRMGALDIVEITDPAEPRSLIINQEN